MPRRFLIMVGAVSLGIVPLIVLLHLTGLTRDLGGQAILVYSVAGGFYIGHYGVKHQDEIPTRSTRR